jgi:hypothetical protein
MIIMRDDLVAAVRLKVLLEQFADVTRLAINFHNNTHVPMHVPDGEFVAIQAALGCRV